MGSLVQILDPGKAAREDCANVLREELRLVEERGALECLVLVVGEDRELSFSYSGSEDLIRLVGLLEVAKDKMLRRMAAD